MDDENVEENYEEILEKDEDIRYIDDFNEYKYQKYNRVCMYGILFLSLLILLALTCSASRNHCLGDKHPDNTTNSTTKAVDDFLEPREIGPMDLKGTLNVIFRELEDMTRDTSCFIGICSNLITRCSNTSSEMNEMIITEYKEKNCSDCKLQIFNVMFPDNTIKKNWLVPNININSLNIGFRNDYHCLKVEEDAFNAPQFKHVTEITFSGIFDKCLTTTLTKNTLKGLENINTFNIQPAQYSEVIFEDELFEMFPSLSTLQLQRCIKSSEDLKKITGDSYLPSVMMLDLRFNNKITKLLDFTFAGSRKVLSLYLDDCQIAIIEDKAFDGVPALSNIYIRNNMLTALSYESFKIFDAPIKLTVKSNPLVCTCDLVWLKWLASETADWASTECKQDLFVNLPEVIESCLQQTTEIQSSLSTDVISSASTTTTPSPTVATTAPLTEPSTVASTEPTSTATTITSTSKPPLTDPTVATTVPLTEPSESNTNLPQTTQQIPTTTMSACSNSTNSNSNYESNYPKMTIDPGYDHINIKFEEPMSELPQIIYRDDNTDEKDTMVTENLECIGESSKAFVIKNVSSNTSYMLCLKNKTENSVNPNDCLATRTKPIPGKEPWLVKENKPNVFLLIALVVLLTAALVAAGLYYLLRKYPKLLKNDQIVVINPRKEIKNPTILLPRRDPVFYDPRVEYLIDHNINNVYLSPIGKRSIRRGSFSESSSGTNTLASYVPIMEPTPIQLQSWRMGTLNRTKDNDIYQRTLPPPIPPPRKQSTYSNVYDRLEYHEYF